jgi:DnaJ-class molecular chaperone
MNKLFCVALMMTVAFAATPKYSTTSVVTLSGAVLKAAAGDSVNIKKPKRKDCPVCKGKGWYISGDGIKKIDCNYCEPEDGLEKTSNIIYR